MKILVSALLGAAIVFAQGPGGGPMGPGGGPMGPGRGPQAGQPSYTELKAYLQLSDAQVQSLQQIQQQQRQAVQQIHEQIGEKHAALRQLLDSNTNDAAAVGRLMLEIETLRKRARDSHTSFNTQAVNVLNAAQKTRLATLQEAEKLSLEIRQARMLQLLAPGEPGSGGRIGRGGPPAFGAGMGFSRYRRPQ